jgi:hypothetical protein
MCFLQYYQLRTLQYNGISGKIIILFLCPLQSQNQIMINSPSDDGVRAIDSYSSTKLLNDVDHFHFKPQLQR